eukprot:TRINITY_DN1967_c0_g1_i1.p1 TRINITY_DN1967_c0_g1~~TRINITY_DN1967_c0_g1_i1.p1  ORF type:complete len:1683 (-),score=190.16 TRINITY_DN1967_c0_g1_i1:3454-8502(-)
MRYYPLQAVSFFFVQPSFLALAGAHTADGQAFDLVTFNSEGELEDYVTDKDYESPSMPALCAGIIIEGSNGNYAVKLRYDDDNFISIEDQRQQIPTTRLPIVNNLDRRPDAESYKMYHYSGFTYLQFLITQEVLRQSDPGATIRVGITPMKTPFYVKDMFLLGAGEFLGFILILCYLAPIFRIMSMLVQDKELKTREGMKMMGLKDSAYWLSFLVYYFVIFVILSVLLASISVGFVFRHSNWFITFLFYLLYGLSVFSFGFFLSTFFNKARAASVTGTMLYFASYLVVTLVKDPTMNEGSKNVSSLLPTVAATLGSISFVNYEVGQYGVEFSNATEKAANYKFSTALIMLTIDIFIYGLLALYLDNVMPTPDGVRKPLYFFLTKQYWTGSYEEGTSTEGRERSNSLAEQQKEDEILYPDEHFERVGKDLKVQEETKECLKVRHLNKFFGAKHSVADFSVNMYKGQIFALLGPNGAGKTTTISMLSGLLPPSSGNASFANMAIFKEMSKIREKLGVCPQHDVLFEMLTPREHLEIFAAFKGRNDTESINRDVEEILQDIELKDSADMIAANLSGGQRRKLSIGIAFIGNSDMIFLDEPTSGIDIAARKRVWAMLKKYKSGKVTILTTHYMEEAEELGDRIGIMANGSLKCVGSPLFLKTAYEAGYNLITVREEIQSQEEQVEVQDRITHYLKSKIEGIKIRKEAGREVTYFLPKNQSKKFKEFFGELDGNLATLRIQSYGVTTNTLEEIFLRVARGEDRGEGKGQKFASGMYSESIGKSGVVEHSELDKYSIANEPEKPFCHNFVVHFAAILLKRLYITMRNWGAMVNELVVPLILILFGLALTKVPMYFDGDARWFNTHVYDTPQTAVVNVGGISGAYNNIDDLTQYFEPGLDPLKYNVNSNNATENMVNMDNFMFNNRGSKPYRYGSLYVKTLDPQAKLYEYVIFANISSQDSAGAFMGLFSEAVLRLATNNPKLKLTFANYPLPLTFETRNREEAKNGDIVSNTLVVSFALVPASIISFIVREREDNLKHQQLVTGVSLVAYWLSNAAMDIFKSLVPCSISIGLIYAFNINLPYGWLLIFLYAFTIIPFTYFTSFFFVQENTAQNATLMFHFFAGVVLSPVFIIFHLFENTRLAGKVLGWIFRIVPSFSMGYGISNISYKKLYAALEGTEVKEDLSFDVAGGDVLFLCICFPIYSILIAMIEGQWFSCLAKCFEPEMRIANKVSMTKDELVMKEERSCEAKDLKSNPPSVLAKHLKKLYRISPMSSTLAVDDISFCTNKGECLALLGTNGAGKTTTFKMLTRDVLPTNGEIYINGMELEKNFATIRKLIGYGPQYESSYMSMTVQENLDFYAKIKGIPAELQPKIIEKLIQEMNLGEYREVQAGQLSGGNKRKLTVAIALLGNPPIVLLDEPSTGVDPQAKRFMWHIIQRISTKNKNTAVILTTHSMEEAEYLCTKMAIMVAGNFCCIGTPQELKEAYGKGFEIQISIPLPNEKDEKEYLERLNIPPETGLGYEDIIKIFNATGRPKLAEQLGPKGNASHMMIELESGRAVKARTLANFLIIEERAITLANEIANEFGDVRVPEHIGNFFKFRVDKSKPYHTIGFLFGFLQDIVEKYDITQYSASQTSLNQIFQSLARQAEVLCPCFNQQNSMEWRQAKTQWSLRLQIQIPTGIMKQQST